MGLLMGLLISTEFIYHVRLNSGRTRDVAVFAFSAIVAMFSFIVYETGSVGVFLDWLSGRDPGRLLLASTLTTIGAFALCLAQLARSSPRTKH